MAESNAPTLNRGLSSNFWWMRSANHVKFTEECVMCEAYFSKKMFIHGLNIGLPL